VEEHIFFATSGFSVAISAVSLWKELMPQVENVQSIGRGRLVIRSEVLFGGCGNGENAQASANRA
jgi:hypothetical protein